MGSNDINMNNQQTFECFILEGRLFSQGVSVCFIGKSNLMLEMIRFREICNNLLSVTSGAGLAVGDSIEEFGYG